MNPSTVALMLTLPLLLIPAMYVLDALQRDRAVESWLSMAGPMADVLHSAMADVDGPAGSSAPTEAVEVDVDADARIECLASDLLSVLDRVETPVTVEADNGLLAGRLATGETTRFSVSVATTGWDRDVILEDENGVRVATVSGCLMVDILSPTVLDAPSEVIAYVGDGELLCAEHGAPFDIGVQDGAVSPILRDNGSDLDAVEYCGHHFGPNNFGHAFCGQCGDHFEPAGHPDAPFCGPFAFCENCNTRSVYVDGIGYRYCHEMDGFNSLPDDLSVTVTLDADSRICPFGWSSRLDPKPSGTVDAVIDASGRRFSASWGFVCYLDDDPSAGVLLVLSESTDNAWDEAVEHFDGALESALDGVTDDDEADDIRSDHRAALQLIRVRPSDAVEVVTKP